MDDHWPPTFRPLAVARDDNHPPQSPPTWRESTAETPPTLPGLMNLNFLYGLNARAKQSESPSTPSMPVNTNSPAVDQERANASPSIATSPNPDGAAMRRSGSNISSTSSDILVAPGLPPEPRRELPIDPMLNQSLAVKASVQHGRLLVIRLPPERLRGVLRREPVKADFSSNPSTPAITGRGGPNARGTYSKEHTLKHPEISWVHRGQGRYLPASALKAETTPASARQSRFHRQSFDNDDSLIEPSHLQSNGSPVKANGTATSTPQSGTPGEGQPQKRRRRPVEETLKDSLTPAPVYGLRRRVSSQKSPDVGEQRSARLARRSRGFSSFDSGRRYSRASQYSETEEDTADEEDEDDDPEDAYDSMEDALVDKAYVDAHPEETFHHTGNSWYKRGRKPKTGRRSKARDNEDGIIKNTDGSFDFDRNKTIHESQLDKFPGCEFHHTGNGWYKAGPAASGKKTSITIPYAEQAIEEEEGFEDDNVKDDSFSTDGLKEGVNGKYSKEYTLLHPEFDWVHRGKGRYVMREPGRDYTPASSVFAASTDRRANEATFDKSYVEAHPEEEFYHIGAGRWKRGTKPSRKSSSTREEITATTSAANSRADPETLYDKAYVKAHPWLIFHHRGQGKYKLGAKEPRRQTLTAESSSPQSMPSFDESSFERTGTDSGGQGTGASPEGLVTTEYVNSHPEQTFYHKGQGRWARGVPPPDSKQKTAVRGPGSKTNGSSGMQSEDENELRGVPGLTALVLKSDGPDKFPDIHWNYRGGGKWSRITKQQFEEMTNPKQYRPATFSRKGRGRGVNDGPAAQLAREAAAADADQDLYGDDDYHGRGFAGEDRPAIKRRRRTKHGDYQANEGFVGGSKASSKPHSKAPTPRPQQLQPEEDVLTEADVPDLYRGSHSPPDPDKDDDAAKLYRKVFPALNVDAIIKGLTKHDPAVRPIENLKLLAENAQAALVSLQDEYLSLERITAPHAKIPRKPAKGGRVPVDTQMFEDRKEADLYDYQYDGRRIGFQDPDAQKIIRDAEGRELRKRRQRHGPDGAGVLPGWDFGDGELSTKRASRQPTRFDGSAAPSTRRKPATNRATPSVTPDRAATPVNNASTNSSSQLPYGYEPPKTGRWAGHIPKRIRELRGESVGTVRSDTSSNSGSGAGASQPANNSGESKTVRKGRPPGSKNHHKRKDAGIKKGPRKKPMVLPMEAQHTPVAPLGNLLNPGPVTTRVAPGVVPADGGYAYPTHSAPQYGVGHAMNGGRF